MTPTIRASSLSLADLVPPGEVERLVAERYVTARRHPSLDLTIYNYTPRCQYEPYWTDATRLLRGLIVEGASGAVVARPFAKFFNLGEVHGGPLPLDEPFSVYEKVDGSLGIAYLDADGLPSLATRGSFVSEQARRGTRILRERYAEALPRLAALLPHHTVMVEIVYPENRIVVDYGDRADLVLLGVLDTATGKDLPMESFAHLGFPLARTWPCPSVDEIVALCESDALDGEEGFVVAFESGHRVKVKREEYQRLHRLVTGVTPRKIWEWLRAGLAVEQLTAGAPPAYAAWVRGIADDLLARHAEIVDRHAGLLAEARARGFADRRGFAELAKRAPIPAILFALYDEKDAAARDAAWKAVRPEPAEPFRPEGE
jgi:RNA ligase